LRAGEKRGRSWVLGGDQGVYRVVGMRGRADECQVRKGDSVGLRGKTNQSISEIKPESEGEGVTFF